VLSRREVQAVFCRCPYQLAVVIEQSDSVATSSDGLAKCQNEFDGHRSQIVQGMGFLSRGSNDFPLEEATLGCRSTLLLVPIAVAASHGEFIAGDNFLGGAGLADGGGVNPDDAMAEAANLIELVGDEDDGATGACDVTHFAEAFFLEVNVTDGEYLVYQKSLPDHSQHPELNQSQGSCAVDGVVA